MSTFFLEAPRAPMHLRVVPDSVDLVLCDCGSNEMYCERVPDPFHVECYGCDDPACRVPKF